MIIDYCYKIKSVTKNGTSTTYIVEVKRKLSGRGNLQPQGVGTIMFGENIYDNVTFVESDIIERFGNTEDFKKFYAEYWI